MARRLKKELSLLTATFYGVGIILGAGIYVLIGHGAALAGNAVWLSFAISAVIAAFTGLSYAELSGMFSKDAAEYVYTKKAFRKNYLAFLVQWILIVSMILAAATVALGFGGYFSFIFGVPVAAAAVGLILLLSLVNYMGMKESSNFNMVSTLIEAAGLVIVIAIGMFFVGSRQIDYFASPSGLSGILAATSIIFFAYIGFEELVNMSEETRNAKKVIPRALVLSLVISTILYILVSFSAISIIGSERLAQSSAPMTDVVSTAIPQASLLVSVIALFATANTALAMMIAVSRMLYGLSRNGMMPRSWSKIGRRQTPYTAIAIVMIFSLLALLIGGIGTIASFTNVGLFLVYISVNASLIWLRYRQPKTKITFRSPVNIGKFPVLAFLGILSSGLILLHFDVLLIVYEIVAILAGAVFYKVFTKIRSGSRRKKPANKRRF